MSLNRRTLIGSFDREEDLLEAVARIREHPWRIVDVHMPHEIHGLDRALGARPSRLPWVAFVGGALGAALTLWFQFWVSAVDWPINVGGRPWNSWPAFVPVTFEMMVLFGGLGIVLAFLIRCRLYPGKRPIANFPGATDDRFVLVLRELDATLDPGIARGVLRDCGAIEVEQREEMEKHTWRRGG